MARKRKNKFGATVLDEATQSFINFAAEIEQNEFLILFIMIGDQYISKNKEEARKSLIEIYADPKNEVSKQLVSFLKTEKADKLFDMKFYERHLSQMAYCRMMDNFVTYFKDILAEIVIQKPEILKSREQETLGFILSHQTIEELVVSISEKKIEELFYKGIKDIGKYFLDKTGIQIFKDKQDQQVVSRLIKQRNLIVHNRGKISKDFTKEFPEMEFEPGLYLQFSYTDISNLNLHLSNYLVEIDIELSQKFGLTLVKP